MHRFVEYFLLLLVLSFTLGCGGTDVGQRGQRDGGGEPPEPPAKAIFHVEYTGVGQ